MRQIKNYREEEKPIIYTDETYGHKSNASQKALQSNETAVNAPISKGERCIIVDAGSEDGFVKGARLIYDGKSTSGDYHGEINKLQEVYRLASRTANPKLTTKISGLHSCWA